MQVFELFFDSLYLSLVLFIGIRMLLIKDKSAPLLGAMTLLLGLGDSFHLIPRIISQVMDSGFDLNQGALFLGTRVSALTMSVFYLLLYLYIRRENPQGQKNWKPLNLFYYGCFLVRILTVFLSFKQSQTMDLISNIPFVLMGLVDLVLLWQGRAKASLDHLAIYVFFSFFFYIPVVLFKNTYPLIGMLMMPKTVMYVLIVLKLYKNIKKDFVEKDIMDFALSYLFLGIFAGALYRELGKVYPLGSYFARLHPHLIVLGFLILSIFYLLLRGKNPSQDSLEGSLRIFNFGIYLTFSSFFLHGLVDPYAPSSLVRACLVGMSGLGHILLSLGLVLLSLKALRSLEERERPA